MSLLLFVILPIYSLLVVEPIKVPVTTKEERLSKTGIERFEAMATATATATPTATNTFTPVPTATRVPSWTPTRTPDRILPSPTSSVAIKPQVTAPQNAPASSGGMITHLQRIKQCESSGDYRAVSKNGLYFGAYQFDMPTWYEVGGVGNPINASPAEQDYRAQLLYAKGGSGRWPVCQYY